MTTWAILLAAGTSTRMGGAGIATRKQFLELDCRPLFWRSARTLARVPSMHGLVFVFPPDQLEESKALVERLNAEDDLGVEWTCKAGGGRRQDSVAHGLTALPPDCSRVLVHDAARPFASPALATALLRALDTGGKGTRAVIPAVAVTDTIKQVEGGRVMTTLERSQLRAVQTPQAFDRMLLAQAHGHALERGIEATDDASLVEALGEKVTVVEGEAANVKITTPEDLRLLRQASPTPLPCTGHGYDVHKYGPGRPMKLGGVPIPGAPEVVAHSDGDVLLHALCDALLGCLGGGDIGQRFPDTDPRFENVESGVLVNEVLQEALASGLTVLHADLTVIAQVPRLAPHRDQIRRNVARLLHLDPSRVNVKATTEEGLGFTGRKQGIKAVAVVTCLR